MGGQLNPGYPHGAKLSTSEAHAAESKETWARGVGLLLRLFLFVSRTPLFLEPVSPSFKESVNLRNLFSYTGPVRPLLRQPFKWQSHARFQLR